MKGIRYIIGCLCVWLVACQQHDIIENTEDAVELTFKIALSDNGSRGNVTDYPNNPANWTQAEKAVDGRYLYTVSVYLVDATQEIVAQEWISVGNQEKEKTVTFDKSFGLKRGVYTLMAVANHANHTIGTTAYSSGLSSEWKSANYVDLINNQIASTTDNISSKNVIQPLSLMKEIELHAGNNMVEGKLIRTFARLRIEVKNNSGEIPLKINSLTFSDNLTQKQAYVFDDGMDRKYSYSLGTGAPVSTSPHALQPFTTDTGKDFKTIEAQASAVVFDSYLLESKVAEGEKYTYTLDLKYEGVTSTVVSYSRSGTAISQVNNLEVGNESYYLIYNTNSGRYLSAEDDVVVTSSLGEINNLGTHVVWQVTKEVNSYYIKNVETGEYLQAPSEGAVKLGTDQVAYTLNQFDNRNNYHIGLLSNNRYVGVDVEEDRWGNNVQYNVQGYNQNSNSGDRYFYFYKVNKTSTTNQGQNIVYNDPIVLTTIDPVTQQSSPATAIRRNDFINVLVTVSYNPVAGKFEFVVEDWNTGSGNVEFN